MKTASKVAVAVIVVLIVAATVAIAFTCGGESTATNFAKLLNAESPKEVERTAFGRPYFEGEQKLDVIIPAEGDVEAQKQLAYELYCIANENYQKAENAAIFVDGLTTTKFLGQEMKANNYRYIVKNGDKYFYAEYSFAADEIGEGMLSVFSPESTLFAQMYYADGTMDMVYAEKIVYPTPTYISKAELATKLASGEDVKIPVEGQIYNVDWTSDDLRVSQVDKPIYCVSQTEKYEATAQKILPETMKSAKVSYNEAEGYYTLVIELDIDNPTTTVATRPQLVEGFGNDTANYTSMVETIEIWDNGYFKNFLSVDCWSGTKIIPMEFVLEFDMHFCFFGEPLDINSYQYATDFIGRATKK